MKDPLNEKQPLGLLPDVPPRERRALDLMARRLFQAREARLKAEQEANQEAGQDGSDPQSSS